MTSASNSLRDRLVFLELELRDVIKQAMVTSPTITAVLDSCRVDVERLLLRGDQIEATSAKILIMRAENALFSFYFSGSKSEVR